jgi:hypothetical protein
VRLSLLLRVCICARSRLHGCADAPASTPTFLTLRGGHCNTRHRKPRRANAPWTSSWRPTGAACTPPAFDVSAGSPRMCAGGTMAVGRDGNTMQPA